MSKVLQRSEDATPEWVTEVLRKNDVLERGSVAAIDLKSARTLLVSNVFRLELAYSPEAPTDAPRSIFLKLSHPVFQPESNIDHSSKEVEFYTSVAKLMPDPPLPHCYAAAFSRETRGAHLLLEDLSETHFQPPSPMPPSEAHCEQAVECLARIHAYWWEHPRLGAGVGELLSKSAVESMARKTLEKFARFADFLGDRLSRERRAMYEKVISCFPAPWKRLSSSKGLTLTHGDAHTWNFMYPREVHTGRTLIIDWQLWHVHIGPRDLAFMMTLYWYPERRARLEEKLLRRYYESLLSGGVKNYSWDECRKDYLWSALRNLFVPVWQWVGGMPPTVWWSSMERAALAFEDLHCIELIES